ncbi:hypothetical protein H9X95_15315, partial [Micromonospora chalcea]
AEERDSFPAGNMVADPSAPTGPAEAALKVELLTAHYPRAGVPAPVYDDSIAAVHSHPNGVLLPTRYAVAERVGGTWQPFTHAIDTPQHARDTLAFSFRYVQPRIAQLTAEQAAAYEQAADHLDATRPDEITVLDRHFRITRVETLLRFSPEGPEGPRPSDYDPDPPPEAHAAQLRAQGRLPEPDVPPASAT